MTISVTHLTATSKGGAGQAAQRIHQAIQQHSEIDSQFYKDQKGPISAGRLAYLVNHTPLIPKILSGEISHKFTPSFVPRLLSAAPQSEIHHLHWVAGMLSPGTLSKLNTPIIWTLHDMWPLTGGCHYPQGCQNFTDACGSCPAITSQREGDISSKQLSSFKHAIQNSDVHFVAPSTWMAEQVKRSTISEPEVTVIPNCLDTSFYSPQDQTIARREFGISEEDDVILTGGVKFGENHRKGGDLLKESLCKLENKPESDSIKVLQFGDSGLSGLTLDSIELGWVEEEMLPKVYSAADVMAVPSRYESFGQTASEAQACGTPVVAFKTSGLQDVIVDDETGALVKEFDTTAYAESLYDFLNGDNNQRYEVNARERAVESWSLSKVAREYSLLYRQV